MKEKDWKRRNLFERIWHSIRNSFKNVLALGRRIYHGAKTLFKSAAEGLMKGYNWVRGQLNRLAGPVVNLFKVFYRGIREGIRLLAQSLPRFFHFVLRRPIITHDKAYRYFATSRFDLDSDAILVVSKDAPADLIRSHARLCRNLARGLRICLIIVGKVFFYLTSIPAGPLNWIRIGFQIASIFDDVIYARSALQSAIVH